MAPLVYVCVIARVVFKGATTGRQIPSQMGGLVTLYTSIARVEARYNLVLERSAKIRRRLMSRGCAVSTGRYKNSGHALSSDRTSSIAAAAAFFHSIFAQARVASLRITQPVKISRRVRVPLSPCTA